MDKYDKSDDELIEFVDDIKSRLSINEDRLEDECRNQPILYEEVGTVAAQLRSFAKKAKDNLDFVKAVAEKEIRTNPEKFIPGKATEGSVSTAVTLHADVKKAKADQLVCETKAELVSVLLHAIESRRSVLRDLVTLFVHRYYSEVERSEVGSKTTSKVNEDRIVQLRREKAEARRTEKEDS